VHAAGFWRHVVSTRNERQGFSDRHGHGRRRRRARQTWTSSKAAASMRAAHAGASCYRTKKPPGRTPGALQCLT